MRNSAILLGFLLLVSACSASQAAMNSGVSSKMVAADEQQDRLIVYNGYLEVVAENVEQKIALLTDLLENLDGYIQSTNNDALTIRINQIQFDTLIVRVTDLGEVRSKNIYTDDVTDQYRDLEIRLETLEKTRIRYLELLNKAEKVIEILEIEKELERINTQIESFKGQLQRLDSQVNYSTLTVQFVEKTKPGVIGYIGIGLYNAVKWLFVRN